MCDDEIDRMLAKVDKKRKDFMHNVDYTADRAAHDVHRQKFRVAIDAVNELVTCLQERGLDTYATMWWTTREYRDEDLVFFQVDEFDQDMVHDLLETALEGIADKHELKIYPWDHPRMEGNYIFIAEIPKGLAQAFMPTGSEKSNEFDVAKVGAFTLIRILSNGMPMGQVSYDKKMRNPQYEKVGV